jgi:hypothetical protein
MLLRTRDQIYDKHPRYDCDMDFNLINIYWNFVQLCEQHGGRGMNETWARRRSARTGFRSCLAHSKTIFF